MPDVRDVDGRMAEIELERAAAWPRWLAIAAIILSAAAMTMLLIMRPA